MSPLGRAVADAPGWFMLIPGLLACAACLIIPTIEESREMEWRLKLMRAQVEQLTSQETGYARFQAALDARDPILLERLAYHQLRLKPEGADPLMPPAPLPVANAIAAAIHNNGLDVESIGPIGFAEPLTNVESLLVRPIPTGIHDIPMPAPVDSHLMTLTTGPFRPAIFLLGMLLVYLGIMWPGATAQTEAS